MDPKTKSEMRNIEAERRNPCHKEYQLSYECLDKNNYDKDACTQHFENYKACKKFWGQVEWSRRFKGIEPPMPNYEDRQKIREEIAKIRKGHKQQATD